MAEYCLLPLSLSLIIIEGIHARRAYMGNSMLQTLHSEGKFLELKLFLTYFSYAIFCLKFVQVFITWYMYLTISRKETLISFSKAVNIFVLSSVTDITKLESADTVVVGSMISKYYCRSWIFLHIICLP